MRVGIDALALGSGRGGDETFLEGVLRGLAVTAGAEDRFTLYRAHDAELPADIAACELFDTRRVTRRPGPAHFGAVLPAALRKSRGSHDMLFAITHAPVWAPNPVVLTIGDLSFRHHPEHYPRATRMRLEEIGRAHV